LEKVESVQTRRVWMFVAAFVVASLLGSAAALALIKIRQPVVQVATEPEGTEQPVAQAPDESPEQTVSETKLPAELADETQNQDAPVAEAPKRAPKTNRSTSGRSAGNGASTGRRALETSTTAPIFSVFVRFLKVHDAQDAPEIKLHRLKTARVQHVDEFLNEWHHHGQAIESHLSRPINRLPRYKLTQLTIPRRLSNGSYFARCGARNW
jgi:hypothetical protein